jgi:transcriptional regulator with XRE-family HTH domain
MHIGLKIKMIRLSKGLKQIDLADKINKTRALVSHIEQTGQVNYYTLETIAKALEIDAAVLNSEIVSDSGYMYYQKENSDSTIPTYHEEEEKDLSIKKLEEEVNFLKQLVKSQLEIIKDLSKKEGN